MTDKLNGYLSEKNSTSTPLGAAATYTGTWEDCRSYDTISFAVRTDQTCTLYADFTSDPTNGVTDSTLTYKIAININEVHRLTITRPFYRIRIVNDSVEQTYLSVSTMLGSHPQLSAPMNLSAGLDADATLVRPSSFTDEVVLGRRSGVNSFTKFGYRSNLTAANGEETIWAASGNFTPLTSASTFTIAYNNATDGVGQNGALSLQISYIDENGMDAVLNHTLGSSGSDVTTVTGLGINRAVVTSSGSTNWNVNDIAITATTGGTTQAFIPATQSVTQQLIFHMDTNSKGVARFLWINTNKLSGGGAPRIVIKGYVFNRTIATQFEIFRVTIDTNSENTIALSEPIGFALSASDVLWFVADTDTNNSTVAMRFSLLEYRND